MKKRIVLISAFILIALTCSSCRKLMCHCTATGYVSESKLNEVLYEHLGECVQIAQSGESVYDDGVEVSCEY